MSNKDVNAELLGEMYKCVKMGCENIADIIPKVEDKFFLGVLTDRLEEFGSLSQRVSDMMHERGLEVREPGIATRLGAKMGIAVNTAIDHTTSHIAEMFIKGSEMGINNLENLKADLHGCDDKVIGLCNDIIASEKNDNKKMEAFL